MGMNHRRASPELGPGLQAATYFLAGQAPIRIVGSRRLMLHATPRIGFASGKIEIGTATESEFQHTLIWGGALELTTFRYHLSGGIALMRAQAGTTGEVGGDHDYGGFFATLGGTIDG